MLFDKQNGKCYWTNKDINIKDIGNNKLDTASIDRLDCNKGYTKDNIVICLKFINLGRGNYPADDFREFLKTIL